MLINLSNHPSNKWQKKQISLAAKEYGQIHDMDFPAVPPEFDKKEVQLLAKDLLNKILFMFHNNNNDSGVNVVHIQGEFTLVFSLITLLRSKKIKCIASTSIRDVEETGDKRVIIFKFEKFREY